MGVEDKHSAPGGRGRGKGMGGRGTNVLRYLIFNFVEKKLA